MQASFLEAHYYAGGLRHRAFAIGAERPEWAPPADFVGFADEFPLASNAAAIELRRLEHNGRRLTWLAVYHASVDARLGDRKNHAGVGIWLDELTVADARSLLHGLDVLAKKLAESVNPDGLEAPAREFLEEYVPRYLLPLRDIYEFPGLQFSPSRLAVTSLAYVRSAEPVGETAAVGDHILASLFADPRSEDASRELIWISPAALPEREKGRFHLVTPTDDPLSRVVRELPAAAKAVTSRLQSLTSEVELARVRTADFDEMQGRLRGLEENPLHTVLAAVNDLSKKVDILATRSSPASNFSGSRTYGGARNKIINHPGTSPSRTPEAEVPLESGWVWLAVYGILGITFVALLIALIDKYLVPMAWGGS